MMRFYVYLKSQKLPSIAPNCIAVAESYQKEAEWACSPSRVCVPDDRLQNGLQEDLWNTDLFPPRHSYQYYPAGR